MKNLKQLLETNRVFITNSIENAAEKARIQERNRILALLQRDRDGYNAERGGMHCSKPYLQKHNLRVEILDEIIRKLEV